MSKWSEIWPRSIEGYIRESAAPAPAAPVQLTGRSQRGRSPNSLANLRRGARVIVRKTNSAENMARLRAAKAAKRNMAVVQTVEIAPVAKSGIVPASGKPRPGLATGLPRCLAR
jgi:hypothetical protein